MRLVKYSHDNTWEKRSCPIDAVGLKPLTFYHFSQIQKRKKLPLPSVLSLIKAAVVEGLCCFSAIFVQIPAAVEGRNSAHIKSLRQEMSAIIENWQLEACGKGASARGCVWRAGGEAVSVRHNPLRWNVKSAGADWATFDRLMCTEFTSPRKRRCANA